MKTELPITLTIKIGEREVHFPLIKDTPEIREYFYKITDMLDDDTKLLRREKMAVYGMSFCQNGFDSAYENMRRKWSSVAEIIYKQIILLRESPSDKQLKYLYDALLDLGNYSKMALWMVIAVYGDRIETLAEEIKKQRQV